MHHIQTAHLTMVALINSMQPNIYWEQHSSINAFGDESFLASTIWGSLHTSNITEEQMNADDKFITGLIKHLRSNIPNDWIIQGTIGTTFKLYFTTAAQDSMTLQFSDHMIYLVTIASGQY